MILQQKFW